MQVRVCALYQPARSRRPQSRPSPAEKPPTLRPLRPACGRVCMSCEAASHSKPDRARTRVRVCVCVRVCMCVSCVCGVMCVHMYV
jgi:hypothetical protein